MKKLNYIFAALAVILMSACQEELPFEGAGVESGLPAGFTIEMGVPAKETVDIKGVNDFESSIGDLLIFLYGEQNYVIHLTSDNLVVASSTVETGYKTYTLNLGTDDEGNAVTTITTDANDNEILSGVYSCYAIANPNSPFCGLEIEKLKGYTKGELEAAMANNANFVTSVFGTELLPMSSELQSITLYPDPTETTGETGTNTISLTLTRLTSHIEFNFVNGQPEDGENPKFTPHSYSIYNIPKQANLISKNSNVLTSATSPLPLAKGAEGLTEDQLKDEGYYAYIEDIDIAGSTIEFLMLENERKNPSGLTAYTQREKWDVGESESEDGKKIYLNAGATAKEKTFTNAPAGSTYIVVKGEYSGKTYFGDISYTIHLGDFGNSTEGYNYNDFSVKRNQHHVYTVRVNGTKSVTTDEEGGGQNPGAEGTLTQNEGQQFVLDAHYETVLLSFPLSACTEGMQMLVDTPYNPMEVYKFADNNYTTSDYDWVHFVAPTSTTALPKFPGNTSSERTDLPGLAAELENANKNNLTTAPSGSHYLLAKVDGVTTVYVAAFVNEYFYDDKEWNTFVNKPNRVLMLNPAPDVSKDGNSLANNSYIFSIVQRSIKTVYRTADPSLNAFGIETWNETGRMSLTSSGALGETENFGLTGLTLNDGWLNTNAIWDKQNVTWPNLGYLKPVTDNTKDAHVFYESGIGIDGTSTGIYAYNACTTRNRDENGNGSIDDNEIKWYLPATYQYLNLWLGVDYLTEDTQLIDPSTISGMSSTDNEIVNFYSSSSFENRLYYPVEGASYGKLPDANNISATNKDQYYYQGVRCVRSLGTYNAETAVMATKDGNIINVTGASAMTLRPTVMSGSYTSKHNERDAAGNNNLCTSFEVGVGDLGALITAKTPSSSSDTETQSITWITDEYVETYTGDREGSYPYTYTYTITFNGISGATYNFGNNTATETSSGVYTVDITFTTTNGSAGKDYTQEVVITASKDSDSHTFTASLTYRRDRIEDNSYKYYAKVVFSDATSGGSSSGSSKIQTGYVGSDGSYVTEYTVDQINATPDYCTLYYYEYADGSDKGEWRIPNQREMQLMIQEEFLTNAKNNNDGTGIFYASRTYPTLSIEHENVAYPYVYTGSGFTQNPSNQRTFRVRCVRDALTVTGGSGGGTSTDETDKEDGGGGPGEDL